MIVEDNYDDDEEEKEPPMKMQFNRLPLSLKNKPPSELSVIDTARMDQMIEQEMRNQPDLIEEEVKESHIKDKKKKS